MIAEVSVTLTVPADRLADLARFCLELDVAPAPAPAAAPEAEPAAPPEKPKKPRRPRRTKAQIAADKAAEEAAKADEAQAEAVQAEAAEAPADETSEDDLRAAVKAAVVDGKLEVVNEAFKLVGVDCVSDVKAEDRGRVVAAIQGA